MVTTTEILGLGRGDFVEVLDPVECLSYPRSPSNISKEAIAKVNIIQLPSHLIRASEKDLPDGESLMNGGYVGLLFLSKNVLTHHDTFPYKPYSTILVQDRVIAWKFCPRNGGLESVRSLIQTHKNLGYEIAGPVFSDLLLEKHFGQWFIFKTYGPYRLHISVVSPKDLHQQIQYRLGNDNPL